MNFLQILVLAAFAACIASFGWALGGFFKAVEKTPPGLRLIQVTGLVFTIAHGSALIQAREMRPLFGLIGLSLYGFSFWLFWSCIRANRQKPLTLAFNSDQPQHLTAHGPYRLVRHPFYSSYLIAWSAGAIASGQTWLWISVAIMTAIYFVAASGEEQKFLASPLSSDYQQYRARTGMFWPRAAAPKINNSAETSSS